MKLKTNTTIFSIKKVPNTIRQNKKANNTIENIVRVFRFQNKN